MAEADSDYIDSFVPTWVNSNIVAGADTTSILTSAAMYHLLKNPTSIARLRQDVDFAASQGRLSKYVTWKESQTLPYLEAVVNEATRMHPPFSLPFERVVPSAGLEVDGYNIPPGTRVGIVSEFALCDRVTSSDGMTDRDLAEPLVSATRRLTVWRGSRGLATRALVLQQG